MANKNWNTQTTNPHTPKNSDTSKSKKIEVPNLKFKEIHKSSGELIGFPKNIGGSVKDKHEALDVL